MKTRTIARWRKAVLATAAAASLGHPLRAQQDAAPTPGAEPGQQAQAAPPAGEVGDYTITKGDTLWDLSQKFLNNPWYWPKIWSLNPYIENPHWIYPGHKLRIQAGQGGGPAQAIARPGDGQPGAETASADAANLEPTPADAAVEEQAPVSDPSAQADLRVTVSAGEIAAANRSVSSTGRLAFRAPPVLKVRSSGMVSQEEIASAGKLDSSFEEKQMLAMYDTAYVRFPQEGAARVGDKLLIFRPDGNILHPKTGQPVAARTKSVGEAKVVQVAGPVVTVQIGRTWEEIERGDLVRPWSDQMRRLAPRPNAHQIDGMILGSVKDELGTLGESQEVFIDKGQVDGVENGNTFLVVRSGDGLTSASYALGSSSATAGEAGQKAARLVNPDESVAMLLVIDVREKVSAAVVVRSVREIEPGDRVSMRPSGG